MAAGSKTVTAFALIVALVGSEAHAQGASNNLRNFFDDREITVNVNNFVRAATNIEFGKYVALSGGVNNVLHIFQPTLID